MKSVTTARFRQAFADLPVQIQERTREAYRQFQRDPGHPSLQFKKVHQNLPIYSARITDNYRAIGRLDGDTVIWLWVGYHGEYDRLLARL